jgi:hypothetical protein
MDPKRVVNPVLGCICTTTLPSPVPEALPLNVIHGTVDVAAHAQPAGAVTEIV